MRRSAAWLLLAGIAITACSTAGRTAPLPTVVLPARGGTTPPAEQAARGGVTASGVVVSKAQAHLALGQPGIVKAVRVATGDQVRAGQVLLELDDIVAQTQLDLAKRTLRELMSQASIASAEQALAAAQQSLDTAQKKVVGLSYPRASDALIKNTKGAIELAREELAKASNAYRSVDHLPDGDPKKAAALVAMTEAQLNLNKLVANYNWYTGKPSDIDTAVAQANLDAAKSGLQEAQWYLAALKGEEIPLAATGSNLAQLQKARDDLVAAQAALESTRLESPISGAVVAVTAAVGEYVSPGEVLVVVSDVSRLQVETTDLSERDVPKVEIGQTVTISVKALNQDVTGRVSVISPVADTLGGDVVYKVTLELDHSTPGLRAGMSVEVSFNAKP